MRVRVLVPVLVLVQAVILVLVVLLILVLALVLVLVLILVPVLIQVERNKGYFLGNDNRAVRGSQRGRARACRPVCRHGPPCLVAQAKIKRKLIGCLARKMETT